MSTIYGSQHKVLRPEFVAFEMQRKHHGQADEWLGTLLLTWIIFISTGMNNYMHSYLCDEINYLFPKLHHAAVEVWQRISNFMPLLTRWMITFPYWY